MSAADYRTLGLQYRQQERFPEAIAALQTAAQLEPDNLDGHVSLGWTQHLAKQDRMAAETLQAVLQQNPGYVPALNAVGIVYLMNNDPVAAATTHLWASWLAPENEIAFYNLSLAWQRLDQHPWAIAAAQKSAQLEPNNPHPHVALAIAQWSKGDQAAAKQSYQQAVDLDARYSSAAFLDYLNEAGFSVDQIATAKQVLQSSP